MYKPFISKALRYGLCVTRGSHIYTCHPHRNHTCIYTPATRGRHPLDGTHCTYAWRDGQAESAWVAVLHRELNPDMVIYPSTNWARCRLTLVDQDQRATATPNHHQTTTSCQTFCFRTVCECVYEE